MLPAEGRQCGVFQGAKTVRTEARKIPPGMPVDDAIVDATVPLLTEVIKGTVRLQRLTGMRPKRGLYPQALRDQPQQAGLELPASRCAAAIRPNRTGVPNAVTYGGAAGDQGASLL